MQISRLSRKIVIPWVALAWGLLASIFAAAQVKQGVDREAARQFAFDCDQVTLKVQERLRSYALILRGGAALFAASVSVERNEWHAYVATLRASGTVPGVQGIGFAEVVAPGQLAAHLARIRAAGFPDYRIYPSGSRPLYTAIIYLEPFADRNLRAFGYDMFSEPVRRAAMEQARDTGEAALSGKVELVQETGSEVQAGTLMYVPVYRNGAAIATLEERRAALIGWSYSPYRMNDLMTGILGDWEGLQGKAVDLTIYDGQAATPDDLLFDSQPDSTPAIPSPLQQRRSLDFNGRHWLLVFNRTTPTPALDYAPAGAALIGGLALSALLFALMRSTINTRINAQRIAETLTAEIGRREALLKESESFGLAILDAVPAEIAVVGRDGEILAVNEPWRHFAAESGSAPGRPAPLTQVGTNYLTVCQTANGCTADDDAVNAGDGIRAVLAGRLPSFSLEYACHSPTQQRWFTMTVTPLGRDTSAGVVITHTDITARKQAAAAMEESRTLFQTIIETAPFSVFWKDRQLCYLGCNTLFAKDAGMTQAQEAIGKDDHQLGWAAQAERYRADDRAVMATGQAKLSYDEPQTTPDGQTRWLRTSKVPLRNRDQAVIGLLGFYEDVTARKQAEETLRIGEERYRQLFDNISSGVAIYEVRDHGNAFIFQDFNKAGERIDGDCRDDLIGRSLCEVRPGIREFGLLEVLQRVWTTGTPEHFPAKSYKEGRLAKVYENFVYRLPTGEIVTVFDDVTAREQARDELLRSNRELEQFSYSISHDMRQPLRMITSYLQLLQTSLGEQLDGDRRDYFNFAIDGAKRLDAMMLGLLEYSRVGRKGEPPAWVDTRAVLNEALHFLGPAMAEARAALRIEGDWPRMLASPDELLRLLQNLVGNALKFRLPGRTPEIVITGVIDRLWWRLSVADNGIGILPDQASRLFTVFQRLQSRSAYEGTGIGLALCRKIAEHHGGTIRVESTGEGQGSTFICEWPMSPVGSGFVQ
ncbi:CHASE domain-containing protein [uncultured Thiodictyon sp.]|uniref:CHASE domain-containing protein n=1 Tax=uncultured Thiodictyon sp. TaxID=1846217 RepID=UPI0025FFBD9C|nr:CHASE domain-containing protein [uncultured Thiodictyon sp.]